MPDVRLTRTAQRAARAVYGSIIALAVIILLDQAGAPGGEVIAAVIGSVAAASLAELYAEYIGFTIRDRHHPSRKQLGEEIADVAAGSLAAMAALVPFVIAVLGPIELDTAYDIAPWLGLGVIGAYTMLANRLAGLPAVTSALVTLVALAVGFSLIAIKTFTH
jgi:hypothetical protein